MELLIVLALLYAGSAQANDGQSWCTNETETYFLFPDSRLIKHINGKAECVKVSNDTFTCSMDWMDGNVPNKFNLTAMPRPDGKLVVSIDGAEAFEVNRCE
ncbi:MAG: hypothetical protein ACK4K8_08875 [Pannonibacter sp.]